MTSIASDWPVGPVNPPLLLSFITPDNHGGLHGPFEESSVQRGQKDNSSMDNNRHVLVTWMDNMDWFSKLDSERIISVCLRDGTAEQLGVKN